MKFYNMHFFPWPCLPDTVDANEYNTAEKWPLPTTFFDPVLGHHIVNEYLDQLAYSEEIGLDGVLFNEHHQLPPYNAFMPSPNLIAAIMTQRTKRCQIGVLGNALPLHGSPLRIAEEYAMLDLISGGRVIAGFVRGQASEYVAMGVNPAESRARFSEAWDLIVKAWTTDEPFVWEGKYYHQKHVCIWPKPLQKPHPPIWVPIVTTDTLPLLVKRRIPTTQVYLSTSRTKEGFDRYRQLAKDEGYVPSRDLFMVLRLVYVADTDKQARDEATKHIDYFERVCLAPTNGVSSLPGYNSPASYGIFMKYYSPASRRPFFDLEKLVESGQAVIGGPETVAEQIKYQTRETGIGGMQLLFQFGSLPHSLTTKNMKTFGESVLPKVRDL